MTAFTNSRSRDGAKAQRPVDDGANFPTIAGRPIGGEAVETVDARDVHAFLKIGKDFTNWVKAQIDRARLAEDRDFVIIDGSLAQKGEQSRVAHNRKDYFLTIDAAKHIGMMSATDEGFRLREYFIACERVARKAREQLDAATMERIERSFGILRSTIHKVTEIEKSVRELEKAKAAPTFDLAATVTSDQIIEIAGIKLHERVKGTTCAVTSRMREFCEGHEPMRTPVDLNPRRPWRFPRERAHEWLFGKSLGAEQIRNQMAKLRATKAQRKSDGQASLRLVPPPAPGGNP